MKKLTLSKIGKEEARGLNVIDKRYDAGKITHGKHNILSNKVIMKGLIKASKLGR
jgi:hypothetical protein